MHRYQLGRAHDQFAASVESSSCLSPTHYPPPHVHDHLLLSVHMYTGGGGFLSDCLANMLWLGGPALTWQSDGSVVLSPRIQAKYVEICSDSIRSIFAVTDTTAQFKTGTADRLAYYTNALSGLTNAIKVSLQWASGILMICRIVAKWLTHCSIN